MSDSARELEWSGGKHTFDLNSRRVAWMLKQAQQPFPGQYGSTPAACLRRFDEAIYAPDDIERVIRFGLIGGGMSEDQAESLIASHVRGQPLSANATVAFEILAALFVGVPDGSASA